MNHEYIAELDGPQSRIEGKRRILHKGGGGATSSTTIPTIPDELKPLANLYTQQATQYAQTPFQAYTGQRFADLNPTQQAGLGMVEQRAMSGSPTMTGAEGALNQFIQGGNTNPYLDAMVNKAQQSVLGNAGVADRRSGSFGNSGVAQAAARQMGDVATNMYGQAYGQDQANRMQAIGMAPTFGNAAYQDASQLLNAGNIRQQAAQNPLDFQYQQFQQAQDYPLKQMSATGGMLGQNMGSSTTGTQPGGK